MGLKLHIIFYAFSGAGLGSTHEVLASTIMYYFLYSEMCVLPNECFSFLFFFVFAWCCVVFLSSWSLNYIPSGVFFKLFKICVNL